MKKQVIMSTEKFNRVGDPAPRDHTMQAAKNGRSLIISGTGQQTRVKGRPKIE